MISKCSVADSLARRVMMGLVVSDDGWRMPDWLWVRIEPVLPAPPPHCWVVTGRG